MKYFSFACRLLGKTHRICAANCQRAARRVRHCRPRIHPHQLGLQPCPEEKLQPGGHEQVQQCMCCRMAAASFLLSMNNCNSHSNGNAANMLFELISHYKPSLVLLPLCRTADPTGAWTHIVIPLRFPWQPTTKLPAPVRYFKVTCSCLQVCPNFNCTADYQYLYSKAQLSSQLAADKEDDTQIPLA